MIPRYSTPEMTFIWSDENKYATWLKIEISAAKAMHKLGEVPTSDLENIESKADFNVARILEIEEETKHDVIAFLTCVQEYVGDSARFLHKGMTSSDVLDTCLSYQIKQSSELIISGLEDVLECLKEKSMKYKNTLCIGRSHGIHAEPITFGLKFASFYAEFERNLRRFKSAVEDACVCAISGPVGTMSSVDPSVQEYVANDLGLAEESISTQVIPRDRYAVYFNSLAVLASSIERLAVEIRHLQRTEVLEVEEGFSKGQKGSSAMPHKKNPILSENLTGIARMIRSYALPAMENIALWHERDISHSSVERVFAPDANILTHFALRRLKGLISNLVVHESGIERNLNQLGGLFFSQHLLLALIEKQGMSREYAYLIVQSNSMKVWNRECDHLRNAVESDERVSLNSAVLDDIFSTQKYTKSIENIFSKVFKGT